MSALARPLVRHARFALGLATSALAFFAAGCQVLPRAQPDPTRFYMLTSPLPPPPGAPEAAGGITIGLRPVELPAYLRTSRSMVVTRGANELEFRDYDRWAEPLEAALARVLRDALAQTETVGRVATFPFGSDPSRKFDVAVRVVHFEGVQQGDRRVARFVAAYEILDAQSGGVVVKQGSYTAPERPWNGEAESLAALLSEATAGAAEAIAADLPQ